MHFEIRGMQWNHDLVNVCVVHDDITIDLGMMNLKERREFADLLRIAADSIYDPDLLDSR